MDEIVSSLIEINKNLLAMYKTLEKKPNKEYLFPLINDELKKENKILDSLTMEEDILKLITYLQSHQILEENPIVFNLTSEEQLLIMTRIRKTIERLTDFTNLEDDKLNIKIKDIDKCIISKPLNIIEKRYYNLEELKRFFNQELLKIIPEKHKYNIKFVLTADYRFIEDLYHPKTNKKRLSLIVKDPYIINLFINKYILNDYRNCFGCYLTLQEAIIGKYSNFVIPRLIPKEYSTFFANRLKLYDMDDKNNKNAIYRLTTVTDLMDGLFKENPKPKEERFNHRYKIEEIIKLEEEYNTLKPLGLPMYKLIKEMTLSTDKNEKDKLYKIFKEALISEDKLITNIKNKQQLAEYLEEMVIQNKVGNNLSYLLTNLNNLQKRNTYDDSFLSEIVEEIYAKRLINKLYKSHGNKPIRATINKDIIETVLDLKDIENFFNQNRVQRLMQLRKSNQIDEKDYIKELQDSLRYYYHTHRFKEINRIEVRSILSYNMIHLIASDINDPNLDESTKNFLLFTKNLIIFQNDLESYYRPYDNNLDDYSIKFTELDLDDNSLMLYQKQIEEELSKLNGEETSSKYYEYFKNKYENGSKLIRKKRKDDGKN